MITIKNASQLLWWAGLLICLGHDSAAALKVSEDKDTVRAVSPYLDLTVSLNHPAFLSLAVDSLGLGKGGTNALQASARSPASFQTRRPGGNGLTVEYRRPGTAASARPGWRFEVASQSVRLISHWSEAEKPEPVVFEFDPRRCHVTLLGNVNSDGSIQLPAVLHLPDQGSFRIRAVDAAGAVLRYDARRAGVGYVKVTFPPATKAQPRMEYHWEVAAIYPKIASLERDPRFNGFRRNWLNIFQLNPRLRVLANHSASDTCAFCLYEYADIARYTPPLAENLTALDLVRQSLDRYLAGLAGYGLPGNQMFDAPPGPPSKDPAYLDSYPSLLIAAADYVAGANDKAWLEKHYAGLLGWANKLLAMDQIGRAHV